MERLKASFTRRLLSTNQLSSTSRARHNRHHSQQAESSRSSRTTGIETKAEISPTSRQKYPFPSFDTASGPEDIKRIGITIVYQPEETTELDIVLVHGLFGNPKRTWTAKKNADQDPSKPDAQDSDSGDESQSAPAQEIFWPRDLLPKVIPTARIMTWGYDVQFFSLLQGTSSASVFQHSEMLISDLEMVRQKEQKKRPIIFIAHSLGGIVVKDALGISQLAPPSSNTILSATAGVMFLGTPHKGSQMATVARNVFGLSRFAFQKPNLQVLRVLEANSEVLERISRCFGRVFISHGIHVHSFREELNTKGISVVTPQSATTGYFHETCGHLNANHRNMAKFYSLTDSNFERVVAVLERWLSEIREAAKKSNPMSRDEGSERTVSDPKPNNKVREELIFDETYKECLASLNSSEVRTRFEDVSQPFANTYRWLFDDDLGFTTWLRGEVEHPVFWFQGKPGCGKSTAMKYIAKSDDTMSCLRCYRQGKWNIITFFFNDRGPLVQRSLNGLAREILFQLLLQQKQIFENIFDFLTEKGIQFPAMHSSQTFVWTTEMVQATIRAIGKNANFYLNLCIFIDALDEHDGDHQGLLDLVASLGNLAQNPCIRLRISLASRPENLFRQEFAGFGTLILAQHTVNDIRTYTKGRLTTAARHGQLSSAGNAALHQLSSKVIASAQGVFLWVKLVIDELVEGVREGDSIEELSDHLETIPSELVDLYRRALLRSRRASSRALARAREEAYYMFQIVAAWREPFTIYSLFSACHFLVKRESVTVDFRAMTLNQLHNRLYNRSAGLLEWSETDKRIRFIHQTAKEYMTTGNGVEVVREWVSEDRRGESAALLIFRYLVHLISCLGERNKLENLDSYLIWRDFMDSATRLELTEKRAIVPEVENAILGLPEQEQENLLSGLWSSSTRGGSSGSRPELGKSATEFSLDSWKDVRGGKFLPELPRGKAMMLLFSVYFSLQLSISHYLASPASASISENDSLGLLRLAAYNSIRWETSFQALIEAGLRKNVSKTSWERHFGPHLEEHVHDITMVDL